MKKTLQFSAFAVLVLSSISISLQAQQTTANFIDMPLGPGWVQYGGEYAHAKLVKQGKIRLAQGLIRNGDWGKISEFPTEFRSTKFLLFPSNNHEGSYSLILYSSHPIAGNLLAHGQKGSHGWASLCGIIYGQTQDGISIPLNADTWKDFSVGGGWETAKYVKEGNVIALMGSLTPPGSITGDPLDANNYGSRLVGQLPEGIRPTKRLVFNTSCYGGTSRTDVLPDGKIIFTSGNRLFTLEGMTFSTAEGITLPLTNGWKAYHRTDVYGQPTMSKHGNICMLSGLVTPPGNLTSNAAQIAQLPEAFRPEGRLIFNCLGADKTARIDVLADGRVLWVAGQAATDWVSLSSIVYAVPGTPAEITAPAKQAVPRPAEAVPGSATFVHIPQVDGETLKFHENWKIAEPGKGWVKFKARGARDLDVAFAILPKDVVINAPSSGGDYRIVVGGWENKQSVIRRNVDGFTKVNGSIELALNNMDKGGNPNAVITGGLPKDGSQWEDYWFQVDNGIVTWGKGAVVGQNEMMRYIDPAPLKYVQYVLLGGYSTHRVEFKDIEFSKIVPVEIPVNLPEKFEAEEGKAKRITVGSRNGELEAWVIGVNNQLLRYDAYSMAPNAWVKQEFKDAAGVVIKFEDVSCASDGTLVAIDDHGKALRYDWDKKAWNPITPGKGNENLDLEFIAAGNKDCIWAVDSDDKDIYELTKDGWVVRADGIGAYLACGVDGTVIALNAKGEAFRYREGKWFEMPGVLLERIAVGDRHHIVGSTDKGNELWQWTRDEFKPAEGKEGKDAKSAHKKGEHKKGEHHKGDRKHDGPHGKWQPMLGKDGKPAMGLDEIAINAAGTIFATDEDGDIYHRGEAGVVIGKPSKEAVAAEIAKAVAAGKPAPKAAVVEKQLSVAKKAAAKKAETRSKAKKEGKIKAKPTKKKTTGKGKILKKTAKAKKAIKKTGKLAKKAQKKASKKKKTVKKQAKKAASKTSKKQTKKPAKKPAKKTAKGK